MTSIQPTIILGGGFTGLFTALHLSHQRYAQPTILIDQEWSFLFKPLLYEFLSGEMNLELIWIRYDYLLKNSGVAFIRDTIQTIDLEQRQVTLASGLHYHYGQLVLALGSITSYFGIEGAQEHAFPFRTAEDAIALGRHLRDCLQRASQTEDEQQRRHLLTVAVLGAGRAGVELAATLGDLLPEWYQPLGGNIEEIRIVIVQRGSEMLKGDKHHLQQTAQQALRSRKVPVELKLETEVVAVHAETVLLNHQGETEAFAAATTIWTTGTATNPLIKSLPIPEAHRDKQGRLQVTSTFQLPDFPEVFVGGDCAVYSHPLPATAQVAYQQGTVIAHNLKALSQGTALKSGDVFLRGTLMKLGLDESAAELFDRVEVKGHLGHLIRQAAYIELLPTPARNFKATAEWLSAELFHRIANV